MERASSPPGLPPRWSDRHPVAKARPGSREIPPSGKILEESFNMGWVSGWEIQTAFHLVLRGESHRAPALVAVGYTLEHYGKYFLCP